MIFLNKLIRRFTYGKLPPNQDGWYFWRLNKTWPKDCYKCIEIANGLMVDSEPMDSSGSEWRVVECKPYGEFKGPILKR